ncbi:MAG TPA: DegT/DnrJ/EryC1/StrS family aminotransferase [Verrucomicrobiae bacterium]|nr:DegT/DnrJ/EryC1/StrS family aminotransferase [Verrucomicrobiae bacterium]
MANHGFKPGDFPEAERAAEQALSLPVHPKVSEADAKHIIDSLKELASA